MTSSRILMLATLLGVASIVHAEDSETLIAIPCTGCHTTTGNLPPIFGRSASELEATMLALKSGAQESTLMMRLLRGYSDDDLSKLAKVIANMPSETAR